MNAGCIPSAITDGEHQHARAMAGSRLELPAARAFTSLVVSGLPPIPHSPLFTSSTTTQVTWRMFSPSMETIVSVRRRIISCFWVELKTPSISLTLINGIGNLLSGHSAFHAVSIVTIESFPVWQLATIAGDFQPGGELYAGLKRRRVHL
jgi:hypothetical protein